MKVSWLHNRWFGYLQKWAHRLGWGHYLPRGRRFWRLGYLLLILLAYTGWAAEFRLLPPWQGPDEPRHLEMVFLTTPLGPKPTPADLDPALEKAIIRSLRETHFSRWGWLDPRRPVDLATAQTLDDLWPEPAHMFQQPSLYYRLAAAWRLLGPDELLPTLYWLRILSTFLGLLALLIVLVVARRLFPRAPAVAYLVAAFVGWQPMLGQMFAVVDNDSLVIFTGTAAYGGMALLLAGVWPPGMSRRAPRAERRQERFGQLTLLRALPWQLLLVALLVWLSVWAKRTGLATVPAFVLLLLWLAARRLNRRSRNRLLAIAALATALLLIVGGIYWQWLNAYLQLSPHTGELWQQGAYWRALSRIPYFYYARVLWLSYWGVFGWLRVPLPADYYWMWGGLCLLSLVGSGRLLVSRGKEPWSRLWLGSFLALIFGLLLIYLKEWLFLSYRVGVVPQGRYLFPEILPMGLLLGLGWSAFGSPGTRRRAAVTALLLFVLLIFDFSAIFVIMRDAFPSP